MATLGKRDSVLQYLEDFVRDSAPGVMLPSERALAEQFSVARMTARAAVDALETAGLVRREQGRGAFVQHALLARPDSLRSFTDDMEQRGMVPGAREFHASIELAGAEVAARLGIAADEEIYAIERVRTADDIPMAIERTTLSVRAYPRLLDHLRASESLWEVLAAQYGVLVASAEQEYTIAPLRDREAARLATEPGASAFAVTQTSRDGAGRVVEYGRSLYRGDRYSIRMQVSSAPRSR